MSVNITEILRKQEEVLTLRLEYWRNEVVFTPQWWFLLVSFIILVIFWLFILDKTRVVSILLFGFVAFSIVSILDTLGGELLLWEYPKMVLPWGPRIVTIDLMISIYFMILYQFFQSWKMYIIASICLSAIFSFILEPFASYLNIYMSLHWSHFYSFPIYILLTIFIKYVVDKLLKIEKTTGY
ncbi:putative integral membrane protein [Metabacillus crassostreae]|uniref:CBO0543 family protein n=1 Tax=Metabacillus crassostreae TaxID=929098 RepID=UPI0019575831|nr:CBO0543 family protein [Metabacillus crassostreae]MBM7604969.1 putative integral membrane protein [Metabacillus crassostreae]